MTAMARIPVRFSYDEETRDWHFVVDQHGWGVVGGGQTTLEEARHAAAGAIVTAIEACEPPAGEDGQVEYLDVSVG
ncbi:MAG TPA: hypothetical protein VGO86_02030 [Candidatus Dormibacteraeota bacterium]